MSNNRNNNSLNKRKSVEIYFVLYLAALLFLLPDKKETLPQKEDNKSYIDFSIYPEKTNLNALFVLDKDGSRIIQLDSLNSIYANSKFENISYNYTIIDPLTNQTMELNEASNHEIYKIHNDRENSSSKFIWKPEYTINNNHSYIVAVSAIVHPKGDNTKFYQAKTQFTLNIIYQNKPEIDSAGLPLDNQNLTQNIDRILDSLRRIPSTQVVYNGDFAINPERTLINMPVLQKWSNTVFFYNVNIFKDLKAKPNVEITGSAPAKYKAINVDIQQNKIIFNGAIPSSGIIKVKISAERKSDGTIKTSTFTVKALPIDDPIYDKQMYVGRSYLIDPNLPMTNRNAYAEIRTPQERLKSSEEGAKFYFTPSARDVGKTLSLRRYLDNNLIEEDLKISVLDYPQPEIISIQKMPNGEIEIRTKSYGMMNAERNLVNNISCNVDINFRELYGSMEESRDKFSFVQTFIISLKKVGDAKLIFSITDKSGRHSSQRNFSL